MNTTTNAPKLPVSTDALVAQFQSAMAGKMDADKMKAATTYLQNLELLPSYGAQGEIEGAIFYFKAYVTVTNGKTFTGKVGALGSAGRDVTSGYVWTADLDGLYANTTAIQITATLVNTSIIFFDTHSNALGTYQGGGVGTIAMVGGGTGTWA